MATPVRRQQGQYIEQDIWRQERREGMFYYVHAQHAMCVQALPLGRSACRQVFCASVLECAALSML